MTSDHLRPVILCGGSGTRLWPLSRRLYPKQFMDLGGQTLFTDTVARAAALPGSGPMTILCNEAQRFLAAEEFRRCDGRGQIILEPASRNTAPAIAAAALALREDGDPLMLVLASDHHIAPQQAFNDSVGQACQAAEAGCLVTFGVRPARPETGFGYIIRAEEMPGGYRVERFVEKPTEAKALDMIASGNCYWNSGMFIFRASVFLAELEKYSPAMLEAAGQAWANRSLDLDFIRLGQEYVASPADSIDYAVMEHTRLAAVTPLSADWNDLGSWQAFYHSAPHDQNGNAIKGDVLVEDSQNCYLHSTSRLIAALGLSGLAVVETADAVLVADLEKSQQVKKITEILAKTNRSETDTHVRVYRPWGSYQVLVMGERFQVKRIIVNPGAALSKQLHHHRAEHWVVARGVAKVTIDDRHSLLSEDQSTYIPLGAVHRLENPGRIPLEIIEIQTGSYLGEDDIVRLEDIYGRPS